MTMLLFINLKQGMNAIIIFGLLTTMCLSMDRPLEPKKRVEKETLQLSKVINKRTLDDVLSLINEGVRLTPGEFQELLKKQDSAGLWTSYGPTIFTTTKLAAPPSPVQQPASLAVQSAGVAAQLPSKVIRNFPDPVAQFYLLLQRENPDLKGLKVWFDDYIEKSIDNPKGTSKILKLWRQTIDYLSVAQSKKLLTSLAKPWFHDTKKYSPAYITLGTNMIEALVEYQCSLRDALLALIDVPMLEADINKTVESFIRESQNFIDERSLRTLKRKFFKVIKDREFCKKYCRDQIMNSLGLLKKEKTTLSK